MPNTVAYGFYSLRDAMSTRVTQIGVDIVRDAITATTSFYNGQVDSMMAGLVQKSVAAKARFMLPTFGTLQPLDEWGNPKPVTTGAYYEMGFPIQGGGTAFGDNRVSREMMTIEMANDAVLDVQRRDKDWLIRHIFGALLTNTSWSFTDPDPNIGSVTVKPLANNDTDTFAFSGGSIATDNHYLAQAASIADGANPFPAIYTKLNEHPDNVGDAYVAYIPTNLRTSIAALTEFRDRPDSSLLPGANSDKLTSDGARYVGFGTEYVGYLKSSRIQLVQWNALPSNYIVTVALGNPNPVLRMREYDSPNLKGLFPENFSPDGNLNLQRFIRYSGFGVFNRTGAVVQQIGNASYQIPTAYSAPLAI